MVEAAKRDGTKHSSETGDGAVILGKVIALIERLAVDSTGRETIGSRAVDRLQGHDEREAFLREMVMAFRPPEADPEIWLRWLSGGDEPFAAPKLAKPKFSQANTRRELTRASERLTAARKNIDKARVRLAAAEKEEAACREFESAIVSWALMERITALVAPIFAMGPGWTLMRVVGPHVEEDEMIEELIFDEGEKARSLLASRVRAERVALSKRLHGALDFWAGDREFEDDLRRAIVSVVEKYEPREEEARAKGRKVRSAADTRSSVRADPAAARREVLGL
jgi:hypothetical protein